jgi:hypothetical protein
VAGKIIGQWKKKKIIKNKKENQRKETKANNNKGKQKQKTRWATRPLRTASDHGCSRMLSASCYICVPRKVTHSSVEGGKEKITTVQEIANKKESKREREREL